MKKLILFTACLPLLFAGCTKNIGKVALTFNKGTAVYKNINDVRSTALVTTPSNVIDAGKIFIGNDFILIGEKGKGIHIFDNTNPSTPSNVAFIQIPYNKEFYVENNMIYAESQYDFLKIDISDIASPTLISRVEYAFAEPIKNENGEVLVGFEYKVVTETFQLDSKEARALEDSYYLYYDYNDDVIPASVVPTSFAGTSKDVKGTLNKIAIYNDFIYVVGDVKLHKFQNSSTSMAYLENDLITSGMETVYVQNDKLFIGTQSSMIIMDLTNPSSPQELSRYNHPTSCDPVYPAGNIAYVTLRTGDFSGCDGDENSLDVLDISDPTNPELINSITMNSPYGLTMINNKLFVGEGVNGMSIFDATDPANLVLISTDTSVEVYDIIEHPTNPNQILTTNDFGLRQYQVDFATMQTSFLSDITY